MSRICINLFVIFLMYTTLDIGEAKSTCGPNAEMRACGDLCEPSCERPVRAICLPIDPSACKRVCACMKGFVRNKQNGMCIEPAQCPESSPRY